MIDWYHMVVCVFDLEWPWLGFWLVVLRIYVALVVFQPYRDLEAGDNQSLKFKWRGGESNPGPLAPQAKSLTTRPLLLLPWSGRNGQVYITEPRCLHLPNLVLYQLFISTWSIDVTWWCVSFIYITRCSDYGKSEAPMTAPITMMSFFHITKMDKLFVCLKLLCINLKAVIFG